MPTSKQIQIYCGSCKQDTNHNVLYNKDRSSESDSDFWWYEGHYLLQCAGCNTICYAVESRSEDDVFLEERGEPAWKTYPSSEGERQPIERIHALPFKVMIIYKEVIEAVNAKLPILAAVGLRALIEAICKEHGIVGNNLEERIDGLAAGGILSASQADILHSHRFLGNVAAHEIERAGRQELLAALEIAESMLKTIYILTKLSDKIVTGKRNSKP